MSEMFKYFLPANIGELQDNRIVQIWVSNNALFCLAFMTYLRDYAHIDDMFFGYCDDRITGKSIHF